MGIMLYEWTISLFCVTNGTYGVVLRRASKYGEGGQTSTYILIDVDNEGQYFYVSHISSLMVN